MATHWSDSPPVPYEFFAARSVFINGIKLYVTYSAELQLRYQAHILNSNPNIIDEIVADRIEQICAACLKRWGTGVLTPKKPDEDKQTAALQFEFKPTTKTRGKAPWE